MSNTATATPSVAEKVLQRNDRAGVATLTLNRPKQYNALSEELLTELQSALVSIEKDTSVRVVVIAASGSAFCAGHDLKEMRANPRKDYYDKLFAQCSEMMLTLTRIPQPVIARVQGIATAAGCQLVAQCDLAVASDNAKFAVSGINVGLFCSTPSVPLGRNVLRKQAMEMLLTGDFIDAHTAVQRGLINHTVPADQLDAAVHELAQKIEIIGRRLHRQADVLQTTRDGSRGRLRIRRRDDGVQHDGRGCGRRHRCLHPEAPTALEGALARCRANARHRANMKGGRIGPDLADSGRGCFGSQGF
jgi:enoyl-CoA hydratase/carnithine racemase